MAICGMESINLSLDSIKPLGVHFSYNKRTKTFKNFFKIENDLMLWRMRNLTIEEKLLAVSKIAHLTLVIITDNSN